MEKKLILQKIMFAYPINILPTLMGIELSLFYLQEINILSSFELHKSSPHSIIPFH
jgi:hypothetical protein